LKRVLARAPAAVGVGHRGEVPNRGVRPGPVGRRLGRGLRSPWGDRDTAAAALPASSQEPHRSDRPGAGCQRRAKVGHGWVAAGDWPRPERRGAGRQWV